MRFSKMEGLGNDFVVLEDAALDPGQVRRLCDRRRGIGADGVLVVDPFPAMKYWNADGSPAEMCGNGLRCVARYAVRRGWVPEHEWVSVVTPVGERRALVDGHTVTVEVGNVPIGGMLTVGDRVFHEANVGNPHAVALVDDPATIDVAAEGPVVSADPAFPRGTNVEYVAVDSPVQIRMRVWERGVGETLACGSGMVAATAVAAGHSAEPVTVQTPGGTGRVYFEGSVGFLEGPAEFVYEGEWPEVSAPDAVR